MTEADRHYLHVKMVMGKTFPDDAWWEGFVARNLPKNLVYYIGGRCNGKTLTMAELYRDLVTKANPDIRRVPDIKNVIFNPPATIVMWADGTKTVVKAINEDYDPEKGLAMAIAKKALGNKGNYFNDIKKWTKKWTDAMELAFQRLHNARRNKKATKRDLIVAMKQARGFLNKEDIAGD